MTVVHPRRVRGGRVRTTHHAPTLSEVQSRVDDWISQFEQGYWPPLSMLARLTEEVGELARELNHTYGHKPKKKNEPAGDIALEVADIIFVLVCLCNSLQIDLGTAFERVMHKYDQRDGGRWTRRPGRRRPGRARRPHRRRNHARRGSVRPRSARRRNAAGAARHGPFVRPVRHGDP